MKKNMCMLLVLSVCFGASFGCAQQPQEAKQEKKTRVILLISEQNIEGPQSAWWASEVDLSTTEARVAGQLLQQGYEVVEPSALNKTIRSKPAYRNVILSESDSVQLGNLSKADYIVVGKAVASSGAQVPSSVMRSCFGNISAKLLRVKDSSVVAYLDASGNTVHMDLITGGKEALSNAASALAVKLIAALEKERVK
jgi:hypothetical protein